MPAPTPTLLDLRSQQASNHIYFTYQFVPQPSLLVGKGRGREGGRKEEYLPAAPLPLSRSWSRIMHFILSGSHRKPVMSVGPVTDVAKSSPHLIRVVSTKSFHCKVTFDSLSAVVDRWGDNLRLCVYSAPQKPFTQWFDGSCLNQ